PDQLRLGFAQLANEPRAATDPIEMDSGERPGPGRRRRVPPPGRRPLPPALPRERIEIDIPEADKICACGHRKTPIGEAVTEQLEYVPRVCASSRPRASNTPARAVMRGSSKRRRRRRR